MICLRPHPLELTSYTAVDEAERVLLRCPQNIFRKYRTQESHFSRNSFGEALHPVHHGVRKYIQIRADEEVLP
jgi:hypothetical protein